MSKQFITVLISMSLITTACFSQEITPSTPLMNDNCNEYTSLGAKIHSLKKDVKLFEFQNKDYVWFCLGMETESMIALDIYIDSPALAEAQNLHMSAQLGQWPIGKREEGPQGGNSDKWWRVNGWWANVGSFNGFRDTERKKVKFRGSIGKEIQLSKNHFGRGDWKLNFNIRGQQSITYPADVNGKRQTMTIIAK